MKPLTRPVGLVKPKPPAPAQKPSAPSAKSEALSRYYGRVQQDLLARGLLRQDGGGPDTQFGPHELENNFIRIAFYDEHARGSLSRADGVAGALHRWVRPVRMRAEFGPSVSDTIRSRDAAIISNYAARLGRVTGHPVGITRSDSANFHVLVASADDTDFVVNRVRQLAPGLSETAMSVFQSLPRPIHCLVLAFPSEADPNQHRMAIALVRAEHPDLMRRSCYHEELAQGLGLANDSPAARPSIFNDDDEFALLTTHDEMLLKMLYDRRLTPGMSIKQARPIIRQIATELTGQTF
ncbi:MAG: hypothetical protein CSA70_04660 [Rhodobacterales bacterium]|nr:MAG: hypothetical protein CSA70_04660 [Rhodobacterales bacterium]